MKTIPPSVETYQLPLKYDRNITRFSWGENLSTPTKQMEDELSSIPSPTPWPNQNARLLGVGAGLPVAPLDRLKNFSPDDFERFTLEWASDFLSKQIGVNQVQQRGKAGDKGRDIVVWLDPSSTTPRRWRLYQCKRYADSLSAPTAAEEIGKLLYYISEGTYTAPEEYWFVTHAGVSNGLQDLLDSPESLKTYMETNWDKYCGPKITKKKKIGLDGKLKSLFDNFDFSIFKAKQPLELIGEHKQTQFHLTVFGVPLIERPPPPEPPSQAAPAETIYLGQIFEVIAENLDVSVQSASDFQGHAFMTALYDRSRITFYCAENLKELARDQMANTGFFSGLLGEFKSGLFYTYGVPAASGLDRLSKTVTSAQSLQLGAHPLAPHVTANDREGLCHHLANDGHVKWCSK